VRRLRSEETGGFIADYDAVVTELTSQGTEPILARPLARVASVGAEPLATAREPSGEVRVRPAAREEDASVGRPQRSPERLPTADPLMTARRYMQNYDAIVKLAEPTRDARTE
jgi:hypothetical protein